jgi:hypothetical protein
LITRLTDSKVEALPLPQCGHAHGAVSPLTPTGPEQMTGAKCGYTGFRVVTGVPRWRLEVLVRTAIIAEPGSASTPLL